MRKHKRLIFTTSVLVCLLVSILSASILFTFQNNTSRQQQLDAFYAQQKIKKDELANQPQSAKTVFIDESISTLKEIGSDITFEFPNCDRLKNRANIIINSIDCSNYSVKAFDKTNMAVVFLWDGDSEEYKRIIDPLKDLGSNSENSLEYINTYVNKEMLKYDKKDFKLKFSFYGPYTVSQPFSRPVNGNPDYAEYLKTSKDTSKANNVPEKNFDLVHYMYVSRTGWGGGVAFPESHRAITNINGVLDVPLIVHETLHLFGASDKYRGDDSKIIGSDDPFHRTKDSKQSAVIDIMAGPHYNSIINPITAREIGWIN